MNAIETIGCTLLYLQPLKGRAVGRHKTKVFSCPFFSKLFFPDNVDDKRKEYYGKNAKQYFAQIVSKTALAIFPPGPAIAGSMAKKKMIRSAASNIKTLYLIIPSSYAFCFGG